MLNNDTLNFHYRVLKTGGEEILHDRWDEAAVEDPEVPSQDALTKESSLVLPDWTRVPMVVGAPHAGKHPPRQFGVAMEEPIAA
jgi:actin-related protein 10